MMRVNGRWPGKRRFSRNQGLIISIPGNAGTSSYRKEENDGSGRSTSKMSPPGGRIPAFQPAGAPGALWFTGWTLLTTAAIPATLIAGAPLAAMLLWLIDQGVNAGLWTGDHKSALAAVGFVIGFALVLASIQSYMLRRFLPQVWLWFVATGAGLLLGALALGLTLGRSSVQTWDPLWIMAVVLLAVGLILGLAHWLYLRRFLPNAFWIILIDVLAAASILLAGSSFTSLVELMVLLLPGAITGLGLWLLLDQSHHKMPPAQREASREKSRRTPRLALIGIGVLALFPLFFACSWIYAASQLALAKSAGIYPTVEEAIVENNNQGWGSAKVIRIDNIHAGPNRYNAQPHVWFGGATVYLDRAPTGHNRTSYSSGSFYLRVRDGWVHIGEGAFPEFIGWVMELYNMEGVH
jgi:hypothetical protein